MIYTEVFRLFFTIAVFWTDLAKGELRRCTLNVAQEIELAKLPLAYIFDTNKRRYLFYPEANGYFTIDSKKNIIFSCLYQGFVLREFSRLYEVQVTCSGGNKFLYNGRTIEYSQFICNDYLLTDLKKSRKTCQPNNNTVYDIGFKAPGFFLTLYSVCFNSTTFNTLYTWYKVRYPYSDQFQSQKRSEFYQESIYGSLDLESIYSISTQRKTINNILNLDTNSYRYIEDKNHFLGKGHFIPRIDFYFAREQTATFNFLNAFPQWEKSNLTWNEIEKVIRKKMDMNRYSRRVIITGVYGTFTLPNIQNQQRELYLYPNRKQVAVPKFHWKILYDADDQRNNIVYISYNNRTTQPQENVQRNLNCPSIACPGTINNRTTDHWMRVGLIYCCTLESFQNAYGRFDPEIFNVEDKIMPAPAA